MDWQPISNAPENVEVRTKIDDGRGCRNVNTLTRHGCLWWLPDGSMYVYYQPTHWMALDPPTASSEAAPTIQSGRREG